MSEIKQMWDLLTKSNAETMQFKLFKNQGDAKAYRMIVFVEGEEAVEEIHNFIDGREFGEKASIKINVPQ